MKKHLLTKMTLLLCALVAGGNNLWATTYKLTKVTSVSAGNKYVFERSSHVLNNSVSSDALQTTATYSLTGLAGTETYIWTLESASGGFYMRSSNNKYLSNSSSTNISLSGSSSSVWTITFENGEALIVNKSNSDRFLGETSSNSNAYKAYAASNLSSYGHDFTVYIVEEEDFSSLTPSNLALTGAPVALTFDLYNNSAAQTIHYTTSSTGAVTVGSSSYVTTSIDSENKTITVTPTAVTTSAQTVTVSQAADATYAPGSATFTVTVNNSAPVINASNQTLAATATEGTIAYTIINPVENTSLTAAETEEWISDVTVNSTNVTFTTTANTAYTSRAGTITLTYGNNLATKAITVKQAAATPPGSKYEWDLSTDNTATATTSAMSWTGTYANMNVAKGSASTNTNNYYPGTANQNYTSTRLYKNSILTINPGNGYKINGVVFTATSNDYASALAESTWTNKATADATNTIVTVIPTDGTSALSATLSNTCGLTKVEVYYELLPVPSVTPASTSVEATAAETDGTINITYNNLTDYAAEVKFYQSDGETLATYDWLDAEINTTTNNLDYLISENTTVSSRTAYLKIYAVGDEGNAYSPLITVTQTGIDYATLPFVWAGGTSTALTAQSGVTGNSLGDYDVNNNAPYIIKMDAVGDYILIKTNEQPAKVMVGVKMIGGATTSKIKVQESANGSTFTDVQELTVSGTQNSSHYLETSNSFTATTRYVRIYKSVHATGGNIGIGPIAIAGATIPITPAKTYTTLTSAFPLDFTGTDIRAFIVLDNDASDGAITMTEVSKVPANTGLVLKAATTGSAINVCVLNGNADDVDGNLMEGSATATTNIAENAGYILSDGKFHPATAGTLPAGKAYLHLAVPGSGAPALKLDFGGETTGVSRIENGELRMENYYDLQGRRVMNPTKGLYIVNDRKVVIR